MSFSKYPASLTIDDVVERCMVFGKGRCPFAKLVEEKKGIAEKCKAFEKGCPFKECGTIEAFQKKLGEMRDSPKGVASYVLFLRAVHKTAIEKELDIGAKCPLFKTMSGCPFALDNNGKPIFASEKSVVPWSVTLDDIMLSCPVFGKGQCPYANLAEKKKGIASNCPAFKEGCPFKSCKTVGEFVELLTQKRDDCKSAKGKAAMKEFVELIHSETKKEEKLGRGCPFNAHVCPFSHDVDGNPIMSNK